MATFSVVRDRPKSMGGGGGWAGAERVGKGDERNEVVVL